MGTSVNQSYLICLKLVYRRTCSSPGLSGVEAELDPVIQYSLCASFNYSLLVLLVIPISSC